MYKRIFLIVFVLTLSVSCGFKNRPGYYYDNHRYNYVRLEKMPSPEDESVINHPYHFTEAQMSTILKMIEIKKGSAFTKDSKELGIFDNYAIAKLTPHLVKAFSEAAPGQKVGFSFMIKDPAFVIRNDRISNGWMWVENNKLHILFDLLYVKPTGDYGKRGYKGERLVQQAKGLRVSLDLQPGQGYGDSTKELVIDTDLYAKIAQQKLEKEAKLREEGIDDTVKVEVVKERRAKERLEELETLKEENIITEKEYQKKREEILQGL